MRDSMIVTRGVGIIVEVAISDSIPSPTASSFFRMSPKAMAG